MAKILLVEDDETLAETLTELLESEHFSVDWVQDGQIALDHSFEQDYDLLLFDVNVPHINGFDLLESLRNSGDKTPAIFITSLSDIASLSHGFAIGVDDYLKKPFDFDELLIRIQALIRKKFRAASDIISLENFQYSIRKNELYKDGVFLPHSPSLQKLIALFFEHLNQTITKENLLHALGGGTEASEGALRVYITQLRKTGLPIQTLKGIGYRLGTV